MFILDCIQVDFEFSVFMSVKMLDFKGTLSSVLDATIESRENFTHIFPG